MKIDENSAYFECGNCENQFLISDEQREAMRDAKRPKSGIIQEGGHVFLLFCKECMSDEVNVDS